MKAQFSNAIQGWWIECGDKTWFSANGKELTESQKARTFEYTGRMVNV